MTDGVEDDLEKIGAALRDARLQALLSQSEVAQCAGVSRRPVSRIEQGLNGEITAYAALNPKGPFIVIHLAVFQFVIGVFLTAAILYLTRRIAAKIIATALTCDAISPDSALTCRREPGHLGWCQDGEQWWHAEVWGMDHWCDTPAAKTPSPSRNAWWKTDATKPQIGGILERCERPEFCRTVCAGKCPLKMKEWRKPTDAAPARLTLQDIINEFEAAAETGAWTSK